MALYQSPPRVSGSSIAHTARFMRDPTSHLLDCWRQCGDLFSLRLLGMGEWVFVCSPELVKEMFKAPADVLAAGEANTPLLGFMIGADSTFGLDGQKHLRRRRLALPYLTGVQPASWTGLIRETAERTIRQWPVGEPLALLPYFHRIALQVILNVVFGADQERTERFCRLFERYANKCTRSMLLLMPFLQWDLGRRSPWGKVLRIRQELRDAFRAEIEGRRSGQIASPESCILTGLLNARLEDSQALAVEQILDEVTSLVFAGHETSGNGMAWTTYELLRNPEVLAGVR